MTEKRFTVPVKYCFSHSKIQLNGEPLTNDELVRILNTNDGAFVENFALKQENEQLKKDLIDHSALISILEDYQALKIEDTLFNLTGAKSEEEFNKLYKPYLEKAKRCYK